MDRRKRYPIQHVIFSKAFQEFFRKYVIFGSDSEAIFELHPLYDDFETIFQEFSELFLTPNGFLFYGTESIFALVRICKIQT